MQRKDNQLSASELSTKQPRNATDTTSNNAVLSVRTSVPIPALKPLDKVKEPPRRKRSRELER